MIPPSVEVSLLSIGLLMEAQILVPEKEVVILATRLDHSCQLTEMPGAGGDRGNPVHHRVDRVIVVVRGMEQDKVIRLGHVGNGRVG